MGQPHVYNVVLRYLSRMKVKTDKRPLEALSNRGKETYLSKLFNYSKWKAIAQRFLYLFSPLAFLPLCALHFCSSVARDMWQLHFCLYMPGGFPTRAPRQCEDLTRAASLHDCPAPKLMTIFVRRPSYHKA